MQTPLTELPRRVGNELAAMPWTWTSLALVWTVLWYLVLVIVPQVWATAEQGETVRESVETISTRLLQAQIRDAKRQWCEATTSKSRDFLRQVIDDANREHHRIAQQSYDVPRCDDLK